MPAAPPPRRTRPAGAPGTRAPRPLRHRTAPVSATPRAVGQVSVRGRVGPWRTRRGGARGRQGLGRETVADGSCWAGASTAVDAVPRPARGGTQAGTQAGALPASAPVTSLREVTRRVPLPGARAGPTAKAGRTLRSLFMKAQVPGLCPRPQREVEERMAAVLGVASAAPCFSAVPGADLGGTGSWGAWRGHVQVL